MPKTIKLHLFLRAASWAAFFISQHLGKRFPVLQRRLSSRLTIQMAIKQNKSG
jgi:hypothetical protein